MSLRAEKKTMDVSVAEWPRIPPDTFHEQKGALHLLVHPDRPRWLIVNDLGWNIAKLCDGRHDLEEIVKSIALTYRKDPALVCKDIDVYMEQLSGAGFLSDEIPAYAGAREASLKRLHFNITGRCNLKCTHCGVADGTSNCGALEKNKVLEVIDTLSGYEDASLAISGGEPLLHEDCFDILSYASESVKTSLSTNATMIDEGAARFLSSLDITLQISLDGPNAFLHDQVRGKGAFDKTIKGIRLLEKHGSINKVTLFVTIMKHNIHSVPEIIRFAEDTGTPAIRFMPLQRLGRAAVSYEALSPSPQEYAGLYTYLYHERPHSPVNISGGFQGFLLQIQNSDCRWCNLGRTLFITSGGGIYPCSTMVHGDFYLGDIHTTGLRDALKSERMSALVRTCSAREYVIEKCQFCQWKNFCQAGCPGSVYARKSSLWDTDDLCNLRRELYLKVIFDIAEKNMDASILRHNCED